MSKLNLTCHLLPNFSRIHEQYEKMIRQKKETCGVYALEYIFKGLGYCEHAGNEITESYLAQLARVNLSKNDQKRYLELQRKVDSGEIEVSDIPHEDLEVWYEGIQLPVVDDPSKVGTSVEGVKKAAEQATKGEIKAIPIPAEPNGFTERLVLKIIDLCLRRGESQSVQVLLNYQTNKCLDVNSDKYSMVDLLWKWEDPEFFPLKDWNVGHFVSLGAKVSLSGEGNVYFLIRDTKQAEKFGSYHLQPLSNITSALLRDDGREGGILVLVEDNFASEMESDLTEIGLELDLWDNGSLFGEE